MITYSLGQIILLYVCFVTVIECCTVVLLLKRDGYPSYTGLSTYIDPDFVSSPQVPWAGRH